MNVEVASLSTEHEEGYTRFVATHPDALITYTLAYRDLLVELLACDARYAVALRGETVVGVMPLMSLVGKEGEVLNSLPYFGSSGSPLAESPQATDALCTWYAEQAQSDTVAAATVIANPLAPRAGSLVHDLTDLRVAHVTPLQGEGDARARIWAAIDGSARRNATKAERCGTEVAVENDRFDELESLHLTSMAAIGAQVKGPDFFAAVPRRFRPREDFDLYIARINGQAVAGLLVFYCSTTVDYYVPAVSPDHRGQQPMSAILITAMAAAAERGFTRWNWGGSWPGQESLQRFKAKWAGVPQEYRYETKLNHRDLLRARAEDILGAYPGFYVLPFSRLDDT